MKIFKTAKISLTIALLLVGLFILFMWVSGNLIPKAYATDCNAITDPSQRLTCLQSEYKNAQAERKQIETALKSENATQSTLKSQIYQLNSQISLTEIDIESNQLLIEQHNLEISMLEKEMEEINDEMATVQQEVETIEASVQANVGEMYKTLCIDDVEVMFGNEGFWNNIDNVKYLDIARQENEDLVVKLDEKYLTLVDYDKVLVEKREEITTMRSEIEIKYGELLVLQEQLTVQKNERDALLAESQKREKEYENQLVQLKTYENQVSQQVTALIMQLYNSGQLGAGTQVTKGDIVGYQGHTGCSMGSHLHFEVWQSGVAKNPCNYLNCGSGYAAGNSSYNAPTSSGAITQYFKSGHTAIDMVSYDSMYMHCAWYEGGVCMAIETYSMTEAALRAACPWPSIQAGVISSAYTYFGNPPWGFRLRGEGSPIYAIADGVVYKSTEYNGGGKYVLIDHGNGLMSLYLHLR